MIGLCILIPNLWIANIPPLMSAIFAGHSLGGAVASLCALRLLEVLPEELHHTVTAIGFASPAFGNAQLAAHVEAVGWATHFTNYLLPGTFNCFNDFLIISSAAYCVLRQRTSISMLGNSIWTQFARLASGKNKNKNRHRCALAVPRHNSSKIFFNMPATAAKPI